MLIYNYSSLCIPFSHTDPVDPVRPEDITFMDVKSDSVIIQWTVAYISYSPETYVVQYGTSRDSLIHNSRSTDSEEGEMMSYSVELSGLRDSTTYYVQVLASIHQHKCEPQLARQYCCRRVATVCGQRRKESVWCMGN